MWVQLVESARDFHFIKLYSSLCRASLAVLMVLYLIFSTACRDSEGIQGAETEIHLLHESCWRFNN
jgi:hypothetical protein